MESVWRCNNDDIDLRRLTEKLIGGVKDPCVWMSTCCLRLSLGIARNDRSDLETFGRFDQWRVKYRAGNSVPDEACAKRPRLRRCFL